MKKLTVFLISLIFISNVIGGVAVFAAKSTSRVEKAQVIVVFKDKPNADLIKRHGGNIKYVYNIIPGIACSLPEKAIDALRKNPNIAYIEKDAILKIPPWAGGGKKEEQPPETLEWGIDRIDADLVWNTNTGLEVKVAILDTGIDKDHPDLKANIQDGVNFVSKPWWKPPNPDNWDDDNGHGTWCAGIVAAVDNEIGVMGVAPQAWLYAVKVLDRTGSGYLSDVIAGIDWSGGHGMQVISMSLGSDSSSDALKEACDEAYAKGLILVAAAGNDGDMNPDDDVDYPAWYSSVIAVAAIDSNDIRASWSSDGLEVELAAPGVDVRSTWKGGTYETHSGTSAACPHVSGTAALILASDEKILSVDGYTNGDGQWTNAEVRSVLQNTADDLGTSGKDNFYGYGLVDAEESATGVQTNP